MGKLSIPLIFELIFIISFVSICLFLVVLVLRLLERKKILQKLVNLKVRNIILIIALGSISFVLVVTGILKVSSAKDISSILDMLQDCSNVWVVNSYYDRELNRVANEKIIIEEQKTIRTLSNVMAKAKYQRDRMRGVPSTFDTIDIYVIRKNNSEIQKIRFSVIAGYLLDINKHRYYSSNEELLYDIRKAIGARDGY